MKKYRQLLILFFILFLMAMAVVYLYPLLSGGKGHTKPSGKAGPEMVIRNYGSEIKSASEEFGVDENYLKALCMLECGGREFPGSRFEPHIYRRLKKVKEGKLKRYEYVTTEMLKDADEAALRNLASSWGPFQLMGYKCLQLGILVKDIRGDQAIRHGVKWINITYGTYLRKGKYRDAFHIHNAGSPFPADGKPRTHHPAYCRKGMAYMKKFAAMSSSPENE